MVAAQWLLTLKQKMNQTRSKVIRCLVYPVSPHLVYPVNPQPSTIDPKLNPMYAETQPSPKPGGVTLERYTTNPNS